MPQTIVIGGGAAGIAAARRLHNAGTDVLLIEASDRLGGRAQSVRLQSPTPITHSAVILNSFQDPSPDAAQSPDDAATPRMLKRVRHDGIGATPPGQITIDLGCGWLHSARRNPWTTIAEATGTPIDRRSPNWDVQWRDLGFPPADQRAFGEAWDRWETAAHTALDGPDQPLAAFIAPGDPWRPMIDAISGYANGANLDAVSLHDWAAYEDAATPDNWALPSGYGTLIADHADGVPVRLDTIVHRIDHSGRAIRLDTSAGTIEAAHVIVCVPTTAIADGTLAFHPALPHKRDAAADLPLGLADKAFLAVDHPDWPAHAHLIGNPRSACTASHRLSPFGWPIVESFFGGDCAEALENEDAALAFATDELVALLGSDWRHRLTPLAATRWRHAPHIHGSYSHARIGRVAARHILAEPIDDRLFFAGEACSRHDFSTAHGAYETGIAAADAILAGLSHRA